MTQHATILAPRWLPATLVVAFALAIGAPAARGTEPAAPAQRTFASAKEGADAFVAALVSDAPGALSELFGAEAATKYQPSDTNAARVERQRLHDAATKSLTLREDAPDKVVLVVGDNAWPFPIPLVKEGDRWRYDSAAGIDELLNRIIGDHELAAIELCRAYVAAQQQYAEEDRDGDQVLEYAQRILSQSGKEDGLYWPDEPGAEQSPFGPFVADASAYVKGEKLGDPYRGYYFKVLKRQGAHPPGGAYDYVINGNMIAGFALLAWPAQYGESGIMTFEVNQQGKVFQKDLGAATATLVATIVSYDPDSTWSEVAEGNETGEAGEGTE